MFPFFIFLKNDKTYQDEEAYGKRDRFRKGTVGVYGNNITCADIANFSAFFSLSSFWSMVFFFRVQ